MTERKLSFILPAKNEAESLKTLLPLLRKDYPDAEIIVVNDGSTDNTAEVCDQESVTCLHAPYSGGNGSAVKRGARHASGEILVFMDADGQHRPQDVERLLQKYASGNFDMVVGARDGRSQATLGRRVANSIYNRLASWMTAQKILDLTSGFRVVDAQKFREFLHLLPNGFSYPTTITMSFFRSGYTVGYVPIEALARSGDSHIRPLQDGIRFLVIIFKVGSLYSPLKLFLPISAFSFAAGLGLYLYTFITAGRFTNMSALMLMTSLLVFLIGLVSEQITALMFSRHQQ
jgi:glycosyltransferase involved in cell wall biosynthesis